MRVKEKWKIVVVEKGQERAAMLYKYNVEWDYNVSGGVITLLDDGELKATEYLKLEKGNEDVLHSAKYMALDVEKSDNDERRIVWYEDQEQIECSVTPERRIM